MIKITNLTKKYYNTAVLNNLNLELPDTGFIIIQGKNGSGKSTLLNLIGAVDKPMRGSITVDGLELTTLDEESACQYRESCTGFIFQKGNLFESMTVEDNINVVGKSERFDKIVDALKLRDLLNKKVGDLSGGEKSRVGIARAVLKDVKIILADEPTASIDPDSKKVIYDLLAELSKTRLVITVSHDREIVEKYGDRIIYMQSGQVVEILDKSFGSSPLSVAGHKNNFNPYMFTFKNFFANKRKLIQSCVFLILAFMFVFLATSLSTLDYIGMHADTMALEGDDKIVFEKSGVFDEAAISALESELGGKVSVGKRINVQNHFIRLELDNRNKELGEFYIHQVTDMTFYPIADCPELIAGSMPVEANEIVVNSYLADMIVERGVRDMDDTFYKPANYTALLAERKELYLEGLPVIVTGIAKLNLDNYEILKTDSNYRLATLEQEYLSHWADHIYVLDSFYEQFVDYRPALDANYMIVSRPGFQDSEDTYQPGDELEFAIFDEPITLKRTEEVVEYLAPNEIIANGSALVASKQDPYNPEERTLTVYFEHKNTHEVSAPVTFRVRGVSNDGYNYMNVEGMRDYLVDPFITEKVEYHAKNRDEIANILEKYGESGNYNISTTYLFRFSDIKGFCERAKYIAGGLALLFAFLAIMFTMNYTSGSVDEHKSDLSLLKALGVRDKEIIPMYIVETSIVVMLSYLTGLVLYFIMRPIVNLVGLSFFNFKVNLLPISIMYIFIILGASILVAVGFSIRSAKKVKQMTPQALLKINSI